MLISNYNLIKNKQKFKYFSCALYFRYRLLLTLIFIKLNPSKLNLSKAVKVSKSLYTKILIPSDSNRSFLKFSPTLSEKKILNYYF